MVCLTKVCPSPLDESKAIIKPDTLYFQEVKAREKEPIRLTIRKICTVLGHSRAETEGS